MRYETRNTTGAILPWVGLTIFLATGNVIFLIFGVSVWFWGATAMPGVKHHELQ